MSIIDQENAINAKYDKLKTKMEAKELIKGYTQEDKEKEIAAINAKQLITPYTQ